MAEDGKMETSVSLQDGAAKAEGASAQGGKAKSNGVSAELKARFKAYLEGEFRKIAPTKAAMEYRKQLLVQMLDRAQELAIRGIRDEELICKTVIDELGDMEERLAEFENREKKTDVIKRKLSVGASVAIAVVAMLAIVYVIVGAATSVWHPTWLIVVGGVFAGATILMAMAAGKFVKRKMYLPVRIMVAAAETLLSVFVFLLLQLVFGIDKSYLLFLAMVALLLGVDAAIAFLTSSKAKWIELPIFVEVLFVMMYVILGIAIEGASIWHPGWIMCLAGVVCALIEIIVFIVARAKKKAQAQKDADSALNEKEDVAYWSQWDD